MSDYHILSVLTQKVENFICTAGLHCNFDMPTGPFVALLIADVTWQHHNDVMLIDCVLLMTTVMAVPAVSSTQHITLFLRIGTLQ